MVESSATALTAFLLARITEDEAAAVEIPAARNWRVAVADANGTMQVLPQRAANLRVLAECEAKRRIIAEHPTAQAYADDGALVDECRRCSSHSYEGLDDEVVEYPCPTMRLLALPYADHPEFDAEWTP